MSAGEPARSGTLFVVAADAYHRLMGRYLPTLAVAFADAAVGAGHRVLHVGCGPGGLTGELVRGTGSSSVCAVDPSPPFVATCRSRHPGVDVREGRAEALPGPDTVFDRCLASLVVRFMADPSAGVPEMRRAATRDPQQGGSSDSSVAGKRSGDLRFPTDDGVRGRERLGDLQLAD